MAHDAPACHPRHGWLAAVVPATARRFAVADADLAYTLQTAGAELVDEHADVEIALPGKVRYGAPVVLVPADAGTPQRRVEDAPKPLRVAHRLLSSAAVRASAERARLSLARHDYRAEVVGWELGAPVTGARLADRRLPLGAVTVGTRRPAGPTAYEAARAAAAAASATSQPDAPPELRESGLLSLGERGVLRVAIGAAGVHLEAQREMLEALKAIAPPAVLGLAPELLAADRTGLADWTLETRLEGAEPVYPLGDRVLDECLDFLAALFRTGRVPDTERSATRDAGVIAAAYGPAGELLALARSVDAALERLPRGFAHGDFTAANILVRDGRLAAVIDWERSSRSAAPLLDLLNLIASFRGQHVGIPRGRFLLEVLLPWASAGGDELSDAYCRRLDLSLGPELLAALAVRYWLGHAAYQLRTYRDRVQRPRWLHENVGIVVDAVAAGHVHLT